jgi:hypothetical protein
LSFLCRIWIKAITRRIRIVEVFIVSYSEHKVGNSEECRRVPKSAEERRKVPKSAEECQRMISRKEASNESAKIN